MKYTPMLRVRVDGQDYTYPKGTTFRAIAADFQSQFPHDILLVRRDEKLCELSKKLDRDCTLRFLTIQDKPGIQTYERTAVLLRCGRARQRQPADGRILPQPRALPPLPGLSAPGRGTSFPRGREDAQPL